MKAYDFEYDGIRLSDKGYIICKFGRSNVETVSLGSNITFNTVSLHNGMKHEQTSSEYKDCITANMQICKHPCMAMDKEITTEEIRDIMSWLNRKMFNKFKLLNDEYMNIYFEASFNISKVEINGIVYGLELEMITNRPFAIHEPMVHIIKNLQVNGEKTIFSQSDEEGYIYPEMEITINQSGNFELYNEFERRTMRIANCNSGEIIHIKYPTITSSLSSHDIKNDFNWKFFRIANLYKNNLNKITISLPSTIRIKYSPIVKLSI